MTLTFNQKEFEKALEQVVFADVSQGPDYIYQQAYHPQNHSTLFKNVKPTPLLEKTFLLNKYLPNLTALEDYKEKLQMDFELSQLVYKLAPEGRHGTKLPVLSPEEMIKLYNGDLNLLRTSIAAKIKYILNKVKD